MFIILSSESAKIDSKIFGKNVHKLRNEAKLTQEELAEMADLSRRYLQEIEAGKYNPTLTIILGLKSALNCSWDDLTNGIGKNVGQEKSA